MKTSLAAIALVCCLAVQAGAQGMAYAVDFSDAPLALVLKDYAEKSGKRVELVEGVTARLTIRSPGEVTKAEYIRLLETKLKEANIGLFAISADRLVATWLQPPKEPRWPRQRSASGLSYAERLRRRREELRKAREAAAEQENRPTE